MGEPHRFGTSGMTPHDAAMKSAESRRRKLLLRRLSVELEKDKDVFKQITEATSLWQLALDKACELADEGDPKMLLQMLQDATDRVRGRATQTQAVLHEHRLTLRAEDLEDARRVADELRRLRDSVTVEAQATPTATGAAAVSSFPAAAPPSLARPLPVLPPALQDELEREKQGEPGVFVVVDPAITAEAGGGGG